MSGLLWSEPFEGPRKVRLVNEERANQITHGAGAVLSLVGSVALCSSAIATGHTRLIVGCICFSVTLSLLYVASTLSHSFLSGRRKHYFRSLDQISIFLFAAGSFSPVGMSLAWEGGWWMLLAAIWVLALIGTAIKLFVTQLRNVPVWFYIVVGWMPLLAMERVGTALPLPAVIWVIAGGLAYTVGTLFLVNDDRVPYFHAVWHLFTITGSTCHFIVMYSYVVPQFA